MRRSTVLLALVLLLTTGLVVAQERQTAFRDLAWGDPLEALGEALWVASEEGIECYERKNEELTIGSLRANWIEYGFFDGRLMTITIGVDDPRAAKRVLEAKFGYPRENSPFMIDVYWQTADTLVLLTEDFVTETGTWTMAGRDIWDEYLIWVDEQVAKDAAAF